MGEEESKSTDDTAISNKLSGSVGAGPVAGASVRILQKDGVELAEVASDASARYNVTVTAPAKLYPMIVESRGGTSVVTNSAPDFDLVGASLEPSDKSVANVNRFTTFIVEIARALPGGIDKVNLETAELIVTSEINSGLTSLANSGVMGTEIDGDNAAEIVRASEALGERVRRTRNALDASGFSATGSSVLREVSSDLTDSVVDGAGSANVDERSAAVWTLVSAQVLLETMANELHVNGSDATQLMDNAIDVVSGGAASPSLAELKVTAAMLHRTAVGLEAAYAVTGDQGIAELQQAVSGIQPGSGSSTVRNFALPNDYRSRLDNAILLVAGGNSAVVDSVNQIAREAAQGGGKSVTLSWNAPTQNEDGTSLTDLAGYRIYWRQGSGNYSNSISINDSNSTTVAVNNLSPGSYEFVATSFNTSGIESRYSAPVTRTAQ